LKYPAKASAGDFEPVPAGTHIAICNMVVDLGIQPGSGMYPKPKRQVYIRYELPNERIDFEKDGKKQNGPAVVGKSYTASMNEKANLRKDLESWRGKSFSDEEAEQFDVASILGKPCMLSITHTQKDGKTYANITNVSKLMKGVDSKSLIPEVNPVYYGPDNTAVYQQLPEWLRKKIDAQILPEKKEEPKGKQLEDDSFITDSDLPPEMYDDDPQGVEVPF
jgi:hypothetical protein